MVEGIEISEEVFRVQSGAAAPAWVSEAGGFF